MLKKTFDKWDWTGSYSIHYPIFYSFIKSNFTPYHLKDPFPLKRIFKENQNIQKEFPLEKYLKNSKYEKSKGNYMAYKSATSMHQDESNLGNLQGKEIILKKIAKNHDLNSLLKGINKILK